MYVYTYIYIYIIYIHTYYKSHRCAYIPHMITRVIMNAQSMRGHCHERTRSAYGQSPNYIFAVFGSLIRRTLFL